MMTTFENTAHQGIHVLDDSEVDEINGALAPLAIAGICIAVVAVCGAAGAAAGYYL